MMLKIRKPWNKGLCGIEYRLHYKNGMSKAPFTEERRRNMSVAHLGNAGYWKGKKMSEETKKKISEKLKGVKLSPERVKRMILASRSMAPELREKQKLAVSSANKGRPKSIETRKKLSEAHKGAKSRFWKGGITASREKVTNSLEYRIWRKAVYERDNYTCIICKDNRGGNLEADHIKPFSKYPDLRLDVNNGRTLCKKCHRKTDTYGGRIRNYITI